MFDPFAAAMRKNYHAPASDAADLPPREGQVSGAGSSKGCKGCKPSPLLFRPDGVDELLDPAEPVTPRPHTRLRSQHYCMRSSIVGQNPERTRAVIIPLPCKSWDCPVCGPRKRAAWIRRLAAGKPTREMTLTCPVGKFPHPIAAAVAMKSAWTKVVVAIRKHYKNFEYAMVWELTKKHVPHVHILFRGTYVSQKWLSGFWDKHGIGPIVYIQKITEHGLHAAHACKYLAKSNGQSAMALAPLRVIQVSQNYCLEKSEPKVKTRYPGFLWTWDKRSPGEVLRAFKEHELFLSSEEDEVGTVAVSMVGHPASSDELQAPELWIAWPGLCPPPNFEPE